MPSLHYAIAPEIHARFPHYVLGVAVFDDLDNTGSPPALAELLRDAEADLRVREFGNVAEAPAVACWREAYRSFGAKPAEHRSSIEAMLRRVLKPDALPSINPLVDIGNIVSLRHLVPAGVHPLPAGRDRIALRLAQAGDRFLPVEGAEPEDVTPGEVVLAAEAEVLTRRWTWRQSALTRTLPGNRRVFFNVDGLGPAGEAQVRAALAQIESLVLAHCGGRLLRSQLLTAAEPVLRRD